MNPVRRGLSVLPVLLVLGCATDDRSSVSGKVTLAGKKLEQGTIMFVPVARETATQVSALIQDGAYHIPRDGGLLPGKYRVAISSPDGKTPDPGAAPDALPGPSGNFASQDRIPAKFNVASTLEVEVQKGKDNTFDFPIP